MKFRLTCIAGAALLCGSAQAAITCSVTSPGFTMNYVANSTMSQQTYFTTSCSRSSSADAQSLTYSVAVNNGLYNQGGNRARENIAGTNYHVRYESYSDSGCASAWGAGGAVRITDTINWTGGANDFTVVNKNTNYWGCVTTAQSGMPAGGYDDTLTMSLRFSGSNTVRDTGTATVRIYAPAACSIPVAPGNVTFNYTAFGSAVNASTNFSVNCTTLMPYTLSLNSNSGTVLGLSYTLGLSAAGGNGTGEAQSYNINGTMAAGQSGICTTGSCVGSTPHTLTVGY